MLGGAGLGTAGNLGAGGTFELANLDGMNGFVLNGIDSVDGSGISVSTAGDINGDGVDDFMIGASGAGFLNEDRESFVVFGDVGLGTAGHLGAGGTFDLSGLDGMNGFFLTSERFFAAGISVSTAGDVNGDGVDDLIIGASGANPNSMTGSGASYVVFGQVNVPEPTSFAMFGLAMLGIARRRRKA